MKVYILSLLTAVSFVVSRAVPAFADPGKIGSHSGVLQTRSAEFVTPPGLRGRVDFWIDIFTRYGSNEVVLHHRDFPQVVFKVLDFNRVASTMSDRLLERFKDRVVKERTVEVADALRNLANGNPPKDSLEQKIEAQMRFLPGGTAKYKKVLDEELIRSQTGIREKFQEAVKRSGRYLPIMEEIFVKEYGLPAELTRLPFVESSFDYQAYSAVGAAGIWQFMPKTGRLYMTVNRYVDERRDPIESTRSAARYLSSAYQRLGSWPLAVASYNHGVAGIANKVKQMGTTDLVSIIENPNFRALGFASSNFFPELLASIEVHDNYQQYFPNLVVEQPYSVTQVRLLEPLSVSYVRKQTGISIEELKSVNYGLSSAVWEGRIRIPAGYNLKFPERFAQQAKSIRMTEPGRQYAAVPPASVVKGGATYTVRQGDTLLSVAKKYKTVPQQLKEINNLVSDHVSVGQRLLVKQETTVKIAKLSPEKAKSKERRYTVRRGDTLSEIAIRYRVDVDTLKRINGLKSNQVRGGQSLRIPSSS